MTEAPRSLHAGPLLDVRELSVAFPGPSRRIPVIEDVNLSLMPGEVLGLVGESGCGKSTLALALLGLLPRGARVSGQALFDGTDLLSLDNKAMRRLRGGRIAMIPQDPMGSLNPLFRVGAQVEEAITAHGSAPGVNTRARALELLGRVRLDNPEIRARQYPHQLSGGMRQRVVGAIAAAGNPDILIADEPTTALDVTVQAQYLDMLRQLQQGSGLSILFITHDLGVVATLCDRVVVMYAGRTVEEATVERLFAAPRHWYTRALLNSVPPLHEDCQKLAAIPGLPPRPGSIPAGCRFHPRCPNAAPKCREQEPPLTAAGAGAAFRCWFPLPDSRDE